MGKVLLIIVVGYFCFRGIELDSTLLLKTFVYGNDPHDWNMDATTKEDCSKAIEKIKACLPVEG